MNYPNVCVVDTNVAKVANLIAQPDLESDVPIECIFACIEAVEDVIKQESLVIDAGDDIFNEYRKQLSMKGQPGVGDAFMKWVHDTRWSLPHTQRVEITRKGDSYNEFPAHDELSEFDPPDRKFVAVANAHADKPPILQATDSKWWGWKDALGECGIRVQFPCEDYIREKYRKKIGS